MSKNTYLESQLDIYPPPNNHAQEFVHSVASNFRHPRNKVESDNRKIWYICLHQWNYYIHIGNQTWLIITASILFTIPDLSKIMTSVAGF